ncbi:MAG: hypothetical protein MHM6MM_003424 [Cercozoa sp. M6MM]
MSAQPAVQLLPPGGCETANCQVVVTIHAANNLKAMDKGGTSDPYVRLLVQNRNTTTKSKQVAKSEVYKKTLDCTPNLRAECPFDTLASLRMHSACIDVFDWDRMGSHDLIGSVEIPLSNRGFGKRRFDLSNGGGNVTVSLEFRALTNDMSKLFAAPTPIPLVSSALSTEGAATATQVLLDVHSGSFSGRQDPYFRVRLLDAYSMALAEYASTPAKKVDSSVSFLTRLAIPISDFNAANAVSIELTMFDYDRTSADDVLCQGTLSLSQALNQSAGSIVQHTITGGSNHLYVSLQKRLSGASSPTLRLRANVLSKLQAVQSMLLTDLMPTCVLFTVNTMVRVGDCELSAYIKAQELFDANKNVSVVAQEAHTYLTNALQTPLSVEEEKYLFSSSYESLEGMAYFGEAIQQLRRQLSVVLAERNWLVTTLREMQSAGLGALSFPDVMAEKCKRVKLSLEIGPLAVVSTINLPLPELAMH